MVLKTFFSISTAASTFIMLPSFILYWLSTRKIHSQYNEAEKLFNENKKKEAIKVMTSDLMDECISLRKFVLKIFLGSMAVLLISICALVFYR
jgi:hypothetical protein